MTMAAYFVELNVGSGAGCCITCAVVHALTVSARMMANNACHAESGWRRAETCKELPDNA